MNRRNLLSAIGSVATGTYLMAATTAKRTQAGSTATFPYLYTADRTSLFYKDWGAGEPVLFVHGWALNADMWQYQMAPMADQGLRCLAFDRRGHGRSSDPGSGYDFDSLAADLASIIEQLNLRNAVLVGHSMGCAEIVRYLARYGSSRVRRIAFVAPSLPFVMKTADNPNGVDKHVLDQVRKSFARDFPKWLADNAPPFFIPSTSPQMVEWGIRMCLQASLRAVIETNRAGMGTDFRAELAKINVPALIIHGDHDASAPLDFCGRRTAQLMPHSELTVYEGAPHGLFITHMDRLNRDLLEFVKA